MQNSQAVLEAALGAWRFHGEDCRVLEVQDLAPGLFASLAAPRSRRIEIVVDHSADDGAWQVLACWPRPDDWALCALVPQELLGQAHENLRADDFELQGWWITEGRVSFGGVEIA